MRRYIMSLGIVFALGLFLTFPATLQAEDLKEGMSQGDFALWLVKAIGAQTKLPPAATGEDAVKFLTSLGVIPEGGWQKGDPLTKEVLASLLEKPEEGANLSFDDLVKEVLKRVTDKFQEINKKQAVFRVLAPTPSLPAL